MTTTDKVKQFWDEQAEQFKASDLATAPDSHYRELEINRIIPHLLNHANILDIGCGNGYSTLKFAEGFPKSKFLGVDYSEPMIREATKAMKSHVHIKNVNFKVGNVLELGRLRDKFDLIISERCLINLANWDEQKKALVQMKNCLNPGGKIVLVENTQEGLANLNRLRAQFDLKPISVRWHNFYIPQQDFMDFARANFKIQAVENIGNLYYIMSRVLYAKLAAMEGEEPDYTHPINAIASKMPSLPGYAYSPNYLFILRNVA